MSVVLLVINANTLQYLDHRDRIKPIVPPSLNMIPIFTRNERVTERRIGK